MTDAAIKCPLIQLGAENNIEKSRCLAQMRKKIFARGARGAGFSGFRVEQCAPGACLTNDAPARSL
jgi:hypothetical protein